MVLSGTKRQLLRNSSTAQGGVKMIYEWRTYEAPPGKLPALHIHLEVAAGLFKKHQLGVLGFWTEEIGTGAQVNYM
jgi:hypothetical protein